MKINLDGNQYKILRRPSIFTNRNNASGVREDCLILVQNSEWGSRDKNDGRLYRMVAMLEAETGNVLREYSRLPVSLTADFLRSNGFLD